jgi:hypothetical protein
MQWPGVAAYEELSAAKQRNELEQIGGKGNQLRIACGSLDGFDQTLLARPVAYDWLPSRDGTVASQPSLCRGELPTKLAIALRRPAL